MPPVAKRLIVALDTPDVDSARALAHRLDGVAGFFKVGMGMFYQRGAERLVDELLDGGKRVFLDAKLYDIGETVRRGVASAARRGVHLLTVHGDPEILRAAVDGRDGAAMEIFAVTVLTSLDAAGLRAMGYDRTLPELIDLRVRAAAAAGVDGVIASAADGPDAMRRRCGTPGLKVATPGIRPAGSAADEQKRTGTPGAAIRAGADYLVVGRPIVAAPDPAAAARAIIAEMEAASGAA